MKPSLVVTLFFVFLSFGLPHAQAQGNAPPTYQLEGQAALMNNFVDYGVSQSNKDPALNGAFWFNWGPQFRMGLWGSNVNYQGGDTHFLLKLNADLKVVFSSNADMTLKFSDNRYYKPGTRNGNTLGLHFQFFGYKIMYEQLSNFMGTEAGATYFAFNRTWDVFQTWKWENQLGYMMLKKDGMTNYFDLRSFIGKKPSSIYYQGGITWNSSPSQFNGASGLFFVVMASVGY